MNMAIRKPKAILLNRILNECLDKEEYVSALSQMAMCSAESLFMSLFQQQKKMIRELIMKIGSSKKYEESHLYCYIYLTLHTVFVLWIISLWS